jgi:membrane carboxypeptidase/penicillin-binding protein
MRSTVGAGTVAFTVGVAAALVASPWVGFDSTGVTLIVTVAGAEAPPALCAV